jgi:EmrB/QacA subfamily drug resistance transporter
MTGNMRRLGMTETNRRWWALGAMCFALFMTMLDTTAVNIALPSIQRSLHASTLTLQWIVNAYTLALAVLLVTAGRLGDLFGRRRMFIIGVILFAASSAAVGASPNTTWVVASRAAQGIGAALLIPATLSIITDLFSAEERGKAFGIWTGVSGMALAIGPLVGGFLSESVSWRAIFFVNLPVALGTLIVALLAVRESKDETAERSVDLPGLATLTIGLTALVLGLMNSITWHLGSAREISLFILAAVALIGFVVIERHRRAPMVDFNFFRSRTFLGASIVLFAATFALFGLMFFLSLYMQNVHNYTPLQTGVRFLPAMVTLIVVSPISGRLTDRVGPRPLIVTGLLAVAAALLWGSYVTINSGYGRLFVGFVLIGAGMGLALPPASVAAMNAIAEAKAGVGAGILSMSRMLGGIFGIAVLGTLMIDLTSRKLDQLMPWLPPGASTQMASNPPSKLALEIAPPEIIYKSHLAFVYGLQYGMRLGALLPLGGALLAWALIAKRQSAVGVKIIDGQQPSLANPE